VRILVASLLLLIATAALGQGLDANTTERLDAALAYVNLSLADLGWDKRPIDDDFRLGVVNLALDRPLALADIAVRAEASFGADPVTSTRAAALLLDLGELADANAAKAPPLAFPGAPEPASRLLLVLFQAYRDALEREEQALAALAGDARRLLRTDGARLYTDESEEDWDMTPVLDAAKKVDLAALARAELRLAEAVRALRAQAAEIEIQVEKPRRWRIDGITVALGSSGPDVHGGADVVLDPGGDDVYTRGGAILDLSGDDTYRDQSGRALLAPALILDLAGNDVYRGGDFVQGGTAFGVSLLVDAVGDDRYDAGQCSQGAAFFGIGLLLDLAGTDAYRGARFVQGFGGTRGVGALADVSGNDTYHAGGRYLHAPLLPENYQSLSQGFGFGLRGASASGGVGVLADHAGNDVYTAEVFGQGASYWFALGVLADSSGHDKYDLFQYGQGAGIHLSAGVLLDRAGSDAYSCNNGVAQGSGHDWGVGLLWDLGGNDAYQGSGMSQGGANANGVGLLVDREGNDSYAGWNVKNQGDSFFARGTIGLGVLLDLGGVDRYTHGGRDDAVWTRGTVGVGSDSGSQPPAAAEGAR
jgi:hypothetical protein